MIDTAGENVTFFSCKQAEANTQVVKSHHSAKTAKIKIKEGNYFAKMWPIG